MASDRMPTGEIYAMVTNTSANGTGGIVYKLAPLSLTALEERQLAGYFLAHHRRALGNQLKPWKRRKLVRRPGIIGDQSNRRSARPDQRLLSAGGALMRQAFCRQIGAQNGNWLLIFQFAKANDRSRFLTSPSPRRWFYPRGRRCRHWESSTSRSGRE